ncbi:FAD-dependent monooxygenase [Bradyrhizobium sp. NP1]|uniref:FAD-dependent monooxygenase n=1 Tax=Bradyrhizobium sp. NP1 TaxID=3049772 RepID=UPI0025A58C04|nr:FAD-dependent monooxygenase [Bradyrhizobium sp. NP1]WJR80976.1 FAD-dependent monooxygenase [Bradyrhizobium sp. NP1]
METVFSEYFPYTHHSVQIPALVAGREPSRKPVVIAGGGPTGLALALGLARYGIATIVLEADDTVCSGSRAGAFTRRTMEILERIGIADEMVRTSYGWSTSWTYFRDKEVLRTQLPNDAFQKYPPTISQLQNYMEHVMVEHAERSGLIDIRWQTRVTAVDQIDDGVRISVETPDRSYELEADWVVACDGGHSTVRKALDLRMEGNRHSGRYIIADVRVDSGDLPPGRRFWFDPPTRPGGTLIMFKKPNGMLRFDCQIREGENEEEEIKQEKVFDFISRQLKWMGIDAPWEPVWLSLYRVTATTLSSYVHDRVIFAGDAAHIMPIFGVRGFNSAIEDTHNLSWKLALVLKGQADPALLQSYSTERVAVARRNHHFAIRRAEFYSPPSRGARVLRDAVLSLAAKHPWAASLLDPRWHSASQLTASPLNWTVDETVFEKGPAPGDVLPECPIIRNADRGFLTDLLGPHFTCFVFTTDGKPSGNMEEVEARLGQELPIRFVPLALDAAAPGVIHDPSGRLAGLFEARPGTTYLIRPDGHVLGRWRQLLPEEIAKALGTILRRAPIAAQPSVSAT